MVDSRPRAEVVRQIVTYLVIDELVTSGGFLAGRRSTNTKTANNIVEVCHGST